jgi:hypothetical protein
MHTTDRALTRREADGIIEKLRSGVPPRRYASWYSAGQEQFVAAVRKRHLDSEAGVGKIRFVNGSWGSGKTHLFRLLTEQAFEAGHLVSTVELSRTEAPFNKFELVLAAILRNIAAPESDLDSSVAPLGELLRLAVEREAQTLDLDLPEAVESIKARLFADKTIDIDVKRVVSHYWSTFAATGTDAAVLDDRRGLLIQWFAGEANKVQMRKEFDVQKTLTKENARLFLGSLVALTKFLGYRGLLVLFDESEMTHSTMRRSDLKQAHNNLLHLINEIGEHSGLMLIYAAVPEFFNDPKAGVRIYGALAARIGELQEKPPAALDKVWNLDAAEVTLDHYLHAGRKIRQIYLTAYSEDAENLPSEAELDELVEHKVQNHGQYERVSRWRAVVTMCVWVLDQTLEGASTPDRETAHRESKRILDRYDSDE